MSVDAGSPVFAEVTGRDDWFFVVQLLDGNANFETLMRGLANCHCRPYMQRAAGGGDTERYQTVYAKNEGAVAAPTRACTLMRPLWPHVANAILQ